MNLADQLGDVERRATTRLRLGRVFMDLKRYQEAAGVMEQGLALNEALPVEFLTLLGKCKLALGEPEPALNAADAALQRDSSQVEAHAVRAAALYDLKRYEEAIKAADAVLRMSPNNALAIRIKAQAIIDGKMEKYIPQAIRLLEVYLRQQPADTARHRLLIRVLRENQRPAEDIMNALRRAVAGEPDNERPAFLTELAETCLAAGHADEAIEALDTAAKIDQGARTAQWWQDYGDAQVQAGKPEEAIHSYEEGLRLDPANAILPDHYAELLLKLDRVPEAEGMWRRLIGSYPRNGRARLRLTEALRRKGDLPGALSAIEEAVGVLKLERLCHQSAGLSAQGRNTGSAAAARQRRLRRHGLKPRGNSIGETIRRRRWPCSGARAPWMKRTSPPAGTWQTHCCTTATGRRRLTWTRRAWRRA